MFLHLVILYIICHVIRNSPYAYYDISYIQILEPSTYVIGGPDMFVDVGSMVNLSCVVSFTEKPPESVVWLHNEEEISFRGPRSGVSVSAITVFNLLFLN